MLIENLNVKEQRYCADLSDPIVGSLVRKTGKNNEIITQRSVKMQPWQSCEGGLHAATNP